MTAKKIDLRRIHVLQIKRTYSLNTLELCASARRKMCCWSHYCGVFKSQQTHPQNQEECQAEQVVNRYLSPDLHTFKQSSTRTKLSYEF